MANLSYGADEPLPLTGERTAPGIPEENYWFQRHLIAYEWVAERVRGMRVLDAGCGEGYGTDLLATAATEVVGVDLDADIIDRAAARYPRARFEAANLTEMPYGDASFDAVVSLQVIEHLHTPQQFLAECKRLLRPGGTIVIATPNRLTFSPSGIRNPFHTFEFAPAELRTSMAKHFTDVQVYGTVHGMRIALLEKMLRTPFPERLIAQPAPDWPRWLRRRVATVRSSDFRITTERVDASLDLIALARA